MPQGADGQRGTTLFDHQTDGTVVTRKEAEVLTFPKFGGIESFRDDWCEARREVVFKSGRKQLCGPWWRQIEDVANVSFEDLADLGRMFEQYDGTIHVAALKSVTPALKRKLRRVEDRLYKEGIDMAGARPCS